MAATAFSIFWSEEIEKCYQYNMHSFSREKKERFTISLLLPIFSRLCLNALLTSFVTRCLRVWTLILPWTQTRAHVWIMPNHQVWIAIVNGKSNPNTTNQQEIICHPGQQKTTMIYTSLLLNPLYYWHFSLAFFLAPPKIPSKFFGQQQNCFLLRTGKPKSRLLWM